MDGSQPVLQPLDIAVIVFYLTIVVIIGRMAGRFTTSTHDFFLGGQRFSWWLASISFIATLVGSYSILQYAELGFRYGVCSVSAYTNEWFTLPLFLCGWLPIIYYNRIQSLPEYFERRFDKRTRMAVLITLMIYLEVYIGINLITIGAVMQKLYPLDPLAWMSDYGVGGLADTLAQWMTHKEWAVLLWAAGMAVVLTIYMHMGGQNSVIATDIFQGLWVVVVGIILFVSGVYYLGGLDVLWAGLPATHRQPFAQFNRPPSYNSVGDFWGDGVVGTFAFYMINQGILMRVLSVRSVNEGRKAILFVVLVMMPLAAIAVSGIGWVGRSMYTSGMIANAPAATTNSSQSEVAAATAESSPSASSPAISSPSISAAEPDKDLARNIFMVVTQKIFTAPGMFGLVVSTVIAALLSVDAYITAVSAVAVNDIWMKLRPDRSDGEYLSVARWSALGATTLGLCMVPLQSRFESVYETLSACTSFIIPPLSVVILLGIAWPKFSARAAFWTMAFGALAMVGSALKPELILPISHGDNPSEGFPYLRGLFGLIVAASLGIGITLFDHSRWNRSGFVGRALFWGAIPALFVTVFWMTPEYVAPTEAATQVQQSGNNFAGLILGWIAAAAIGVAIARFDVTPPTTTQGGLTLSSLHQAKTFFKGGTPNEEGAGQWLRMPLEIFDDDAERVHLPQSAMQSLSAHEDDLVYITDARPWLGGFRSLHARVGKPSDDGQLRVSAAIARRGHLQAGRDVQVTKMI